jgi:adenylosuccinate lyase
MEHLALTALSPLDGRYAAKTRTLAPYLSEFGLIHARLRVEIEWLKLLAATPQVTELTPLSTAAVAQLDRLVSEFSPAAAARVKEIERRTNHDVKALEYWIREQSAGSPEIEAALPFVHFACTSEDINNLAYGLALNAARSEVLLPAFDAVRTSLVALAHRHAAHAMLARTHGQAATPTTLGKEMANFAHRLGTARVEFAAVALTGKMNGAVGNYNAHLAAYPAIDWPALAQGFVCGLGLEFNAYTTQIEPHDSLARYLDALARANTVVLDLCRDVWGYISLGYFKQALKEGEIGSSTMPHKVNPIDFENAEGNVGIANALLRHLAEKLPVSRWQRDLSDSTALRNCGVALGHSLLALSSVAQGLGKLQADPARLAQDLDANWEVLGEAIQTVLRQHGVSDGYEQLKALTRGRPADASILHEFIDSTDLPAATKARLRALTPSNYLGLAAELARAIK